MKAISIWQPWASAIVIGSKLIETRGWATTYRGPLLIHAAKRRVKSELLYLQCCWNWCAALRPLGLVMGSGVSLETMLPFGSFIGSVDLVECRPTDEFTNAELHAKRYVDGSDREMHSWTEAQLGDFSLGRYGWQLANPRRFETPIPYVGRQQLFEVPDSVVRKAMEAAA